MKKKGTIEIVAFAGVMIIVVVFFIICRCGFFVSDDWAMGVGLSSFREIVEATIGFYKHWGGGVFGAFCQYLFCGLWIGNKLWFDLVNTLMFFLTLLLCGKLIGTGKKNFWPIVLLLSLLLWFLVPMPSQTFFWPVGSIGYMWSSVLSLLFLWMFERHKQDTLPLWKNLALLLLSLFCMIGVVGIVTSGVLVLYYLFYRKELGKTAWFMFIGCFAGGLLGTLAPGNFARAGVGGEFSVVEYLSGVLSPLNVIRELAKYRAFWLLVVGLVLLFVMNKAMAKEWCRKHGFLLFVLGGGVFVNSTVFAPYISSNRTLYFSEVLSIVLLLGVVYSLTEEDHAIPSIKRMNMRRIGAVFTVFLFGLFVYDSSEAIASTIQQRAYNERSLDEIRLANGVIALDKCPKAHRMTMDVFYPKWAWEGMATKMGLDSVHVYPYYCQDKYFEEPLRFAESIYVDKVGVYDSQGMVVIRCPETDSMQGLICRIDYNRPQKWYRYWIDKLRHYQFERTVEVSFGEPEVCYQGYCYHVIWMNRENCKNIRRIMFVERG